MRLSPINDVWRALGVAAALACCASAGRAETLGGPDPAPANPPSQATVGPEPWNTGFAFVFDNDMLLPQKHDYDYTAGLAVTLSGARARRWPVSLDAAAGWLDRLVPGADRRSTRTLHALQAGAIAFTPRDLAAAEPLPDDRPYASLVFLANRRTFVAEPTAPVYQTSFTLGLLGLGFVEALQRTLHEHLPRNDVPEGWAHQISNGGEPTLGFGWTRQALLVPAAAGRVRRGELKWSLAASAGYSTELGLGLEGRWGRFETPWWSDSPGGPGYLSRPPLTGAGAEDAPRELYLWSRVGARVHAYNVFLEGQFRSSDVEVSPARMERLTLSAALGFTWQISPVLRISYALHLQTPEIENGIGRRDLRWAAFFLTHGL